jgi:hypothetical protein
MLRKVENGVKPDTLSCISSGSNVGRSKLAKAYELLDRAENLLKQAYRDHCIKAGIKNDNGR